MDYTGKRVYSPIYRAYFKFDGTYWIRDSDQTEGPNMEFELDLYPYDGPDYGPFLANDHVIRIQHSNAPNSTERVTYARYVHDYAWSASWRIFEIDPEPNRRVNVRNTRTGERNVLWLETLEGSQGREWVEYERPSLPAQVECCECSETTEQPARTYSDTFVCLACADTMVDCDYCNEFDVIDIMRETVDNGYICPDHRNYRTCSWCERYESRSYLNANDSGDYMCGTCADENYYYGCESCGVLTREGDYCESCEDERHERDSNGLIEDYDYKPYPVFHGSDTTDGIPFLGIELEVSANRSLTACAEIAANRMGNLGYLKEDSSIDCGFEIVSHPMTHDYARNSFPWGMLTDLQDQGADADDNGIHVHISRKGFNDSEHVYRFMRLFYSNVAKCVKIARRPEYTHWCRFRDLDDSELRNLATGDSYGDRYSAINMQNDHTIELRLFRGSLDKQEVMAAFDLAHASVEYTRENECNDWATFELWLDSHSDKYSALIAQNGK